MQNEQNKINYERRTARKLCLTHYYTILDEVYKASARSSVLDAQDVRFVNANTVQLFKMSGLANYRLRYRRR